MKIAIIVYPLRVAGGLSVGKNVLASLNRVSNSHEYLLLMPADTGYEKIEKPPRTISSYYRRTNGAWGQYIYENFHVPKLIHEFGPDVVWGLGNFGLKDPKAKQAILFHKSQFIYENNFQDREALLNRMINKMIRRRLERSLPETQLIFCQTKTAASRFRRFFNYSGKIALMPNAVSRFITNHGSISNPSIIGRLRGKFILFCLTKYYAHKNLEIFVKLFKHHAQELHNVVIILTVKANQHIQAPKFLAAIEEDPILRKHLINVGPLDQNELPAYFTHSDGVILPTLLESFSGTYLEAMQFHCPILTSDKDFAHDICGSAAYYFNPIDPTSIRDAILKLKNSPKMKQLLISQGVQRVNTFVRDWDSIVTDAMSELEILIR